MLNVQALVESVRIYKPDCGERRMEIITFCRATQSRITVDKPIQEPSILGYLSVPNVGDYIHITVGA